MGAWRAGHDHGMAWSVGERNLRLALLMRFSSCFITTSKATVLRHLAESSKQLGDLFTFLQHQYTIHCCDNKIYFCTHFGCLQVTRALDKAEAILHPVWQEHLVKFYSKAEQIERNWTCTNYSQVGIILDCTVQECNRPLARQSTYTPLYFLHKRKERDLSYK